LAATDAGGGLLPSTGTLERFTAGPTAAGRAPTSGRPAGALTGAAGALQPRRAIPPAPPRGAARRARSSCNAVIAAATGLPGNKKAVAAQLAEGERAGLAAGTTSRSPTRSEFAKQRAGSIGVRGRKPTGAQQPNISGCRRLAERCRNRARSSAPTALGHTPPPAGAAGKPAGTPLLSRLLPGPGPGGRHQLITLIQQPHRAEGARRRLGHHRNWRGGRYQPARR